MDTAPFSHCLEVPLLNYTKKWFFQGNKKLNNTFVPITNAFVLQLVLSRQIHTHTHTDTKTYTDKHIYTQTHYVSVTHTHHTTPTLTSYRVRMSSQSVKQVHFYLIMSKTLLPMAVFLYTDQNKLGDTKTRPGARCSSVVRAFTHGWMGRWIDPSWWTHWVIFRSSQWSSTGVTKAVY